MPILGGGRLTGRVGPFSIGALGIGTGSENTVGAEPTAFTVLRVSRDILRRSRIGAIYTGRSVSLSGPGSNEVYGADGQFAFFDNVYVNGYYARSRTVDRVGDDASYQGVFTYNGDLVALQLDHLRVGSNFNPRWASCGARISAARSPPPTSPPGPAPSNPSGSSPSGAASTTSRPVRARSRRASRNSAFRPSSRTATGSAWTRSAATS